MQQRFASASVRHKKDDVFSSNESWVRILVNSRTKEQENESAHTTDPAKANTVLTPNVRKKVLFPDIFEPVMMAV
ncbi:MAG: hypothetical protein R2822_10580 [Spirosomataceae bacterium]